MGTCLSRRQARGLMGEHSTEEGASAAHVVLLARFETGSLPFPYPRKQARGWQANSAYFGVCIFSAGRKWPFRSTLLNLEPFLFHRLRFQKLKVLIKNLSVGNQSIDLSAFAEPLSRRYHFFSQQGVTQLLRRSVFAEVHITIATGFSSKAVEIELESRTETSLSHTGFKGIAWRGGES